MGNVDIYNTWQYFLQITLACHLQILWHCKLFRAENQLKSTIDPTIYGSDGPVYMNGSG